MAIDEKFAAVLRDPKNGASRRSGFFWRRDHFLEKRILRQQRNRDAVDERIAALDAGRVLFDQVYVMVEFEKAGAPGEPVDLSSSSELIAFAASLRGKNVGAARRRQLYERKLRVLDERRSLILRERATIEAKILALTAERAEIAATYAAVEAEKRAALEKRFPSRVFVDQTVDGPVVVTRFGAGGFARDPASFCWRTGLKPAMPLDAPFETPLYQSTETDPLLKHFDRAMKIDGYCHSFWLAARGGVTMEKVEEFALADFDRKARGVGKTYLRDPRFFHVVFDFDIAATGFLPPADVEAFARFSLADPSGVETVASDSEFFDGASASGDD